MKKATNFQVILLTVIGLLMGTVFVFGILFWNAPIDRSDAIRAEATFSSYKENFSKGSSHGMTVYFQDFRMLDIDGYSVDDELKRKMESLEVGDKVQMLIHPNSDTIMDMQANGESFLNFSEVKRDLSMEKNAFFFLGLFLYALGGLAVVELIRRKMKGKI